MSSSKIDSHLIASGSLKGKTALVTGASRGIGAGIAHELALRGCHVVLAYTSASSLEKTEQLATQIERDTDGRSRTCVVRADMKDLDQVRALADKACEFDATLRTHSNNDNGTGSGSAGGIDFLINNAGAAQEMSCKDTDFDVYQHMMDVNVKGPLALTSSLVDRFRPGGRIVNLSSVAARNALKNHGSYCATKAAIEALTRCWAHEFGRDKQLTVNAVNPGPVESDMWQTVNDDMRTRMESQGAPSGERIGTPKDIALIVAFLCSEGAQWCNASVINANGGITPV